MTSYSRFIGSLSANRKPSIIRELTKILASAPKEIIPLHVGMPNPDLFPFEEANIKLKDEEGTILKIAGSRMNQALQYTTTNGLPELLKIVKELQFSVHSPPKDTEIVITPGSQDGLCKAFEMLLSESSFLVTEEYVYSGTLAITNPYNPRYIVIESDSYGMKPESLRERLDKSSHDVKVLYINPTGSNPTGTTLSLERRRLIYEICCEKDILILEDDPYFYLQFGGERVPSFLSMDNQERVLRFDSFSKILSSGIRLGFVSGPKALVERIVLHMQASVLHASTFSQVLVLELLQTWGIEGFLDHARKVETYYEQKRDIMNEAATKHLKGLCEWAIPGGGMFLWIKVHGIDNSWDMIMERAMAKNVMLLPGKAFMPDPSKPCSYVRAAFSLASEDDINVAFKRLAQLIREETSVRR